MSVHDLDKIDEYGNAVTYPSGGDGPGAEEQIRYNITMTEREMEALGDTRPWLYGPIVEHIENPNYIGQWSCRWYGTKAKVT
jgi:hypothetical protein